MLSHQSLDILGTVNVIVDEICGEGTWISYIERCQKFRAAQEDREAKRIEKQGLKMKPERKH